MLRPALLLALCLLVILPARAALYVTIVQGLEGMPEYGTKFSQQSEQIHAASVALTGEDHVTRFSGEEATREKIMAHLQQQADIMGEDDRFALYLIGHGSFDGITYKFNIPGPDLSAEDLDTLLGNMPGSSHFVLNTSSASGAMMDVIAEDNHILITATRNGNERNSTEFGAFFAEAMGSTVADINKNDAITIQEAFDYALTKTESFYTDSGKLATEHPQLRGEQAAAFTIGRAGAPISQSDDPGIARLQERSREIDSRIEALQFRRLEYSSSEYTALLRELILESAQVEEELDALQNGDDSD